MVPGFVAPSLPAPEPEVRQLAEACQSAVRAVPEAQRVQAWVVIPHPILEVPAGYPGLYLVFSVADSDP